MKPPRGRKITDQQLLEAWQEIKQGKTVKSLAERYGYKNHGERFSDFLLTLIPEEEYRKYVHYSARRSRKQRGEDGQKSVQLFDKGLSIAQIASELKISYTQVWKDLRYLYPDKEAYQILMYNWQSPWTRSRLTRANIDTARLLLKTLPLRTVENIIGMPLASRSGIRDIAEREKSIAYRANASLLGYVAQWLLGRYISEKYTNEKWHICECVTGVTETTICPDFWTENEFWESKAMTATRVNYPTIYKKQLKPYLEKFQKGTIVFWFGVRIENEQRLKRFKEKNKMPYPENLKILTGADLANDCSQSLRTDIEQLLKGNFLHLVKKWYGFRV